MQKQSNTKTTKRNTKAAQKPVKAAAPKTDAKPDLAPLTRRERAASHQALREYMRERNMLAVSPQIHGDANRIVAIRVSGHRDAEKTPEQITKSDRSRNLLYALRAVYGDKPFFAAGLDNSILGMLRSAGLIAESGGAVTVTNGIGTLSDAEQPVTFTVTENGLTIGKA